MKGTFKLLTFANIPVYIHWSFGLIFLWVFYNGYTHNSSLEQIFFLGLLLLVLFACVTLHEYGHALTAKRFGITTRDIVLSPIGGIARLENIPNSPSEELKIAIAGPLVNVGIALLLSPYFFIFPIDRYIGEISFNDYSIWEVFIPSLIVMNLTLAAFNMIPAFPLDGGRVFRALLAIKLSRLTATRIASLIGQILAIIFILYGIFQNNLIEAFPEIDFFEVSIFTSSLIGIFVFFTALQEFRHVKFESALSEFKVSDLIRTEFTSFQSSTKVNEVHEKIMHSLENRFLVLNENEEIKGIIHEEFILDAIKNQLSENTIEPMISSNFTTLSIDDNLKDVLHLMQTKGYYLLPVKKDDNVIGVIDSKMLNQFLRKLKKK